MCGSEQKRGDDSIAKYKFLILVSLKLSVRINHVSIKYYYAFCDTNNSLKIKYATKTLWATLLCSLIKIILKKHISK